MTSSRATLALRMRSTSPASAASATAWTADRTVAATAPGIWSPLLLRMRRASLSRWRASRWARRAAARRRHQARKPAGGSLPPPPCVSPRSPWVALISIYFEDGEEGFLRDLHVANLFHPLLTFLLTLQQLALARYVAAVTLGGHVLAQRLHGRAGDDPRPDRGLNRHLELLLRDELLHLDAEVAALVVGPLPVDDQGQRIDAIAVHHQIHTDEIGRAVVLGLVVQRRVAARNRLQPVIEPEHHLGQRQIVTD